MWYSPVKCGYGWVWRGGSDFFFPSAGTEGVIPTPLPRITLACWEKIANAWHKEICSLLLHSSADICIFESESDVTYDQVWWPILGICALQFYPSKVHTHSGEHTPWTHTRSSWGFGALLKGTSVVVLRVERALYIHSPHLQFLPARDSNSQPFNYESDSLTIRPWLPLLFQIPLAISKQAD